MLVLLRGMPSIWKAAMIECSDLACSVSVLAEDALSSASAAFAW